LGVLSQGTGSWRLARALIRRSSDRAIERWFRLGPVQRAFFDALSAEIDRRPEAGFRGRLDCTLEYAFRDGRASERWTVAVGRGPTVAARGGESDAPLSVRASVADFVRTVSGDPGRAGRAIAVEGNLLLASRLEALLDLRVRRQASSKVRAGCV
jgi:hypothetical protein